MSSSNQFTVPVVDESVMGALVGLSDLAVRDVGRAKARASTEEARVERARKRREDKKATQERRDLVSELVRLIRDDATPTSLSLCGQQRNADDARSALNPTIEDALGGIDAAELQKIAQVLPRNRSLEHLHILRNNLNGPSMLPLRNALVAVHSNLLTLDVSRNPIGSIGVIHLADALED